MADISGFHTLINNGSHGQGNQSLKENFQDHEKRRKKRCLFKLPDLGQQGFEHKKTPFFLLFKKIAPLEKSSGLLQNRCIVQIVLSGKIFLMSRQICVKYLT